MVPLSFVVVVMAAELAGDGINVKLEDWWLGFGLHAGYYSRHLALGQCNIVYSICVWRFFIGI
jgi:hypothetical protein